MCSVVDKKRAIKCVPNEGGKGGTYQESTDAPCTGKANYLARQACRGPVAASGNFMETFWYYQTECKEP